MARTSLLNRLQQWARELQALETAERPDKKTEGLSLTRRQFLAGMGAAGMAAVLPKWAKAAVEPRIAIVGGGIAGLSCALALHDRGVRATVYEASYRVGGRMFSKAGYWEDEQVSEWCGELIDSNHQTILKLAQRFRLPVDDLLAAQPDGSEETYYFFGSPYSYAQAKADFAQIFEKVKADLQAAGYPTRYDSYTQAGWQLDHLSIYDWIESRVPGGHDSAFGQLLDVAYNIEYGAETRDQSALNLLYLLGYQPNSGANAKAWNVFGVSDERYHIRGGNQRLPQAIRNYLGEEPFRLGMELTGISRTANQDYALQFKTSSNKIESAFYDYVVLAIPFAVLREIDYSEAGFDPLKRQAIQELGRGRNGKLQLQFESRFWTRPDAQGRISSGSTYSGTGYQSSWEVSRAQGGNRGILNLYSGAGTTLAMATRQPFAIADNMQVIVDARTGLEQLEPVFPGIEAEWNGKATQSLPHRSRFFKASYAYYRVGQYTAFGGYENVPQEGVLFCGEHTSQNFQGYMEGGASEGERAAKALLTVL